MAALQPFNVLCPACETRVPINPKVKGVEQDGQRVIVTLAGLMTPHQCEGSRKFPHPTTEQS